MLPRLLDNDLYKFTMQQAVLELFPNAWAKYTFINRGNHKFTIQFIDHFRESLDLLSKASISSREIDEFKVKCPYLKPWYFEFLRNYKYNLEEVDFHLDLEGNLHLTIEGPWYRTILWEVPLLYTISKVYFKTVDTNWKNDYPLYRASFFSKLMRMHDCHVTDFGTRRRRDFAHQSLVVEAGTQFPNFSGTSNVLLSIIHHTRVVGTMAHEWIMGNSILEGLRNANYYALNNWVRVFNASLGTALTDTYGTDAFLNNFNLRLSKLYDGVRQDSGNPFVFVSRIANHYESLNIDPMSKVVLFSDNLTPEKVMEISSFCKGKIKCSFGIGTNFTNDFAFCDSPALNMVIKLSELNRIPVVKLSEDIGKTCGDKDAVRVARWTFNRTSLDAK